MAAMKRASGDGPNLVGEVFIFIIVLFSIHKDIPAPMCYFKNRRVTDRSKCVTKSGFQSLLGVSKREWNIILPWEQFAQCSMLAFWFTKLF